MTIIKYVANIYMSTTKRTCSSWVAMEILRQLLLLVAIGHSKLVGRRFRDKPSGYCDDQSLQRFPPDATRHGVLEAFAEICPPLHAAAHTNLGPAQATSSHPLSYKILQLAVPCETWLFKIDPKMEINLFSNILFRKAFLEPPQTYK